MYKCQYILGYFPLALQCNSLLPSPPGDEGHLVGIHREACPWVVERIEHYRIQMLAGEFPLGMFQLVLSLQGKANKQLLLLLCSQRGQNILSLGKLQGQRVGFLFDFLRGLHLRLIVGHSSSQKASLVASYIC